MKIIFLDIDGVLNFNGCKSKLRSIYFVDDEKIQLLKKIVTETGAKIVLSSTWRYGWNDAEQKKYSQDAKDFIVLQQKFQENGLTLFSKTSILNDCRGEEIAKWLNDWTLLNEEPVESFVILDDDTDMKPVGRYLIQTSMNHGLTEKHVKKAIKMLKGGNVNV